MSDHKPLYLFANWKMYLDHEESVVLARSLVSSAVPTLPNTKMVVFPSALATNAVMQTLKSSDIGVGAQNVYWVDKGGYTGEVSAGMYKALGCNYALIGHSERRHVFHESNGEVRHKLEAVLAADMVPVLCVGETLRERKDGVTEEVIEAQLRAAFTDLALPEGRELIVAYEPVWAVSTGESCDPVEAERIAELITKYTKGLLGEQVNLVVLYGGSVRPDNVASFISQECISGVLVGGASTKTASWIKILQKIPV